MAETTVNAGASAHRNETLPRTIPGIAASGTSPATPAYLPPNMLELLALPVNRRTFALGRGGHHLSEKIMRLEVLGGGFFAFSREVEPIERFDAIEVHTMLPAPAHHRLMLAVHNESGCLTILEAFKHYDEHEDYSHRGQESGRFHFMECRCNRMVDEFGYTFLGYVGAHHKHQVHETTEGGASFCEGVKVHALAGGTLPGYFLCARQFDDSMVPTIDAGSFVVSDRNMNPAEGEIVLATIELQKVTAPPPRWQWRKRRAWQRAQEDLADACFSTVRVFGHDEDGAVKLTPLNPTAASYTDGVQDGVRTSVLIDGVRTRHVALLAPGHRGGVYVREAE